MCSPSKKKWVPDDILPCTRAATTTTPMPCDGQLDATLNGPLSNIAFANNFPHEVSPPLYYYNQSGHPVLLRNP